MPYVFNPFTRNLDVTSTVIEGFSLPVGAVKGDEFYDLADGSLYIYYNTWIKVGTASPAPPTDTVNVGIPIGAGDYLFITYP